jgi:hypothetical protein
MVVAQHAHLKIAELDTKTIFHAGTKRMGESNLEQRFKAEIVWLILNGKVEEALNILAKQYGASVPRLKVGLPKGRRRKAFGCYSPRTKTISVLDSDRLMDPFVILHEFYHHIRTTVDAKHRGTERHADEFAKQFINAYKSMAKKT